MSVADLLILSVTVERPTGSLDAMGGPSKAYTTVGTIPGRLSGAMAADRTFGGQLDARVAQVCYFAGGADVRRDDRLTVPGHPFPFRVIARTDPSIASSHAKVLLEEIQTGARTP